MRDAFHEAYVHLAQAMAGDGDLRKNLAPRKVAVDAIRDRLKTTGWLECDDDGNVDGASRMRFQRARETLTAAGPGGGFIQEDELIWARPLKI